MHVYSMRVVAGLASVTRVEPDVRYARNDTVSIAYEVVGDGPLTLVCLSPFDNLEIIWENPLYARYLRRLGELAQVIVIDRRGTGLSDRFAPESVPPLEDLVDDITVVLDACAVERAVVFGFEEAAALRLGHAYQRATEHHLRAPAPPAV